MALPTGIAPSRPESWAHCGVFGAGYRASAREYVSQYLGWEQQNGMEKRDMHPAQVSALHRNLQCTIPPPRGTPATPSAPRLPLTEPPYLSLQHNHGKSLAKPLPAIYTLLGTGYRLRESRADWLAPSQGKLPEGSRDLLLWP